MCLAKHMSFGSFSEYEGETKELWMYAREEKVGEVGDTVTFYERSGERKIRTEILDTGSLRTGGPCSGEPNERPYLVIVPEDWKRP